ncbi:MAG: glutathione S-transferase N-terminal domain-containing protein [Pseudomonadota bacterium]
MSRATLFGSRTSPYVRLARLVIVRANAEAAVSFEVSAPFDDAHRAKNPLGKVPALQVHDGPLLAETSLIVRTINGWGTDDLFPEDPAARLQAEADLAMLLGVLDLGVAYFLETQRPKEAQSKHWLDRRLEGIRAALPYIDAIAKRAVDHQGGITALALAVTTDWLSFRLSDAVSWNDRCPAAAALTDTLLAQPDIAATDPRAA